MNYSIYFLTVNLASCVCKSDKLPYSIRILLESAIRNCDGFQVKKEDVEKIIDWENTSPKQVEIPFKPARVLLQVNVINSPQMCYNFLLEFYLKLFVCFPGFHWRPSGGWPSLHARCHGEAWQWSQQDQSIGIICA